MEAFYVYGTQVFPGLEVHNLRHDFFRDHRLGEGAKWFSLCPHSSELRKGSKVLCRECGQAHFAWAALESRTIFLPRQQQSRDGYYEPLGSLVLFHEEDQSLPGKYLIGLPPEDQPYGAIVLWRVIVPEANGVSMATLGSALYRNTGLYSTASGGFHIIEMLALIDRGHGMVTSTSDWRSVLTWDGTQINFQTTLRVPDTVDG